MSKPITDTHMRYDMTHHRYVLTTEYVREVMNRDLESIIATHGGASDVANEAEIFLDRVSQSIYNHCLRYTVTPLKREREMALDMSYRPAIKAAMGEQVIYMLNNGDLSVYSGVNVTTGSNIDAARMRLAEISPIAKDILARAGLTYRGFVLGIRDIEPNYEKEGY